MIRPGDTGQRIPCFDSCQLTTTRSPSNLMGPCHNIDVQSVFSWAPWAPKVARKCESNIGMPVVWAGSRSVYGHMITKFSRTGSLPHFLTHGAPQARFTFQTVDNIYVIYSPRKNKGIRAYLKISCICEPH